MEQAPSRSSTLNLLIPNDEDDLPEGIEPPPKNCGGQYKILLKSRSFNVVAVCFGLGFGQVSFLKITKTKKRAN